MCRILAVRTDSTFSSSSILLLLDEKGLADKARDLSCSFREMRNGFEQRIYRHTVTNGCIKEKEIKYC
jgi:hypothetical protein